MVLNIQKKIIIKSNYIVPYPLEKTLYHTGTKIVRTKKNYPASHQLELYDESLEYEPVKKIGIKTLKLSKNWASSINAIKKLEKIIDLILDIQKISTNFGGEHSLHYWCYQLYN